MDVQGKKGQLNAISVDRSSVRYRSLRPDDAALRARMRELAAERRRFGYRRLGVLLERNRPVMAACTALS
jgi:putative transposase